MENKSLELFTEEELEYHNRFKSCSSIEETFALIFDFPSLASIVIVGSEFRLMTLL